MTAKLQGRVRGQIRSMTFWDERSIKEQTAVTRISFVPSCGRVGSFYWICRHANSFLRPIFAPLSYFYPQDYDEQQGSERREELFLNGHRLAHLYERVSSRFTKLIAITFTAQNHKLLFQNAKRTSTRPTTQITAFLLCLPSSEHILCKLNIKLAFISTVLFPAALLSRKTKAENYLSSRANAG